MAPKAQRSHRGGGESHRETPRSKKKASSGDKKPHAKKKASALEAIAEPEAAQPAGPVLEPTSELLAPLEEILTKLRAQRQEEEAKLASLQPLDLGIPSADAEESSSSAQASAAAAPAAAPGLSVKTHEQVLPSPLSRQ